MSEEIKTFDFLSFLCGFVSGIMMLLTLAIFTETPYKLIFITKDYHGIPTAITATEFVSRDKCLDAVERLKESEINFSGLCARE